jgi:hypothetical protein
MAGAEAPGRAAEAEEAEGGDAGVPVLGGMRASGGVLLLEGGVIWLSGSILEGGIAEELTEWDVFKIYAERDLLEKSVLARDRF